MPDAHRDVDGLLVCIDSCPDDGDKTLIIFDQPRDVAGTAFLNYTHRTGNDDQWLYLPALRRVKRISSSNKSGPFMGSEFAYEDISSQEVEKYTYRWLRDEIFEGLDCFVVEYYPVDTRHTGYSKQTVWIDKNEYRVMKVDYYDRRGSLLKTLTVMGYRKYLDRFWRADETHMANHLTGKSTLITWTDYRFGTGMKDSQFNKTSLGRVR